MEKIDIIETVQGKLICNYVLLNVGTVPNRNVSTTEGGE